VNLLLCGWRCRHSGVAGVVVCERQPKPAQSAAGACAVLQSANHEHRKLSAVTDSTGDCQRRPVSSYPGFRFVAVIWNRTKSGFVVPMLLAGGRAVMTGLETAFN